MGFLISNEKILDIDENGVTFLYKDYNDEAIVKPTTMSGVEFLRRFCMHILPQRFVKVRYYGILDSRYKKEVQPLKDNSKPNQTSRNQAAANSAPHRFRPLQMSEMQHRHHA